MDEQRGTTTVQQVNEIVVGRVLTIDDMRFVINRVTAKVIVCDAGGRTLKKDRIVVIGQMALKVSASDARTLVLRPSKLWRVEVQPKATPAPAAPAMAKDDLWAQRRALA